MTEDANQVMMDSVQRDWDAVQRSFQQCPDRQMMEAAVMRHFGKSEIVATVALAATWLTAVPVWAGYNWGGDGMGEVASGTVSNGAVYTQSVSPWPAYTSVAGGYSTQFTAPACDDVVASRLVLGVLWRNGKQHGRCDCHGQWRSHALSRSAVEPLVPIRTPSLRPARRTSMAQRVPAVGCLGARCEPEFHGRCQ